jgi:hypothetical protein
VRCVYSSPGRRLRLTIFCITRWLHHVEEHRPGPGWWRTGSDQHCIPGAPSCHNAMANGPHGGLWISHPDLIFSDVKAVAIAGRVPDKEFPARTPRL